MNKHLLSLSHKDGLLISRVGDEVVIYDPETTHAVCLNPIVSVVWELLAECRTQDELLAKVRASAFPQASEEAVELAISELVAEGLLVSTQGDIGKHDFRHRREILKQILRGAALLPAINSVTIGTAMAAISGCIASGLPCQIGVPCCRTNNTCAPGQKVCS